MNWAVLNRRRGQKTQKMGLFGCWHSACSDLGVSIQITLFKRQLMLAFFLGFF